MRLIGWAIALAAAGMTPAAAQTTRSTQSVPAATSAPTNPTPTPEGTRPAAMPKGSVAEPSAGFAQFPNNPSPPTTPSVAPGTVGHALPTPGIGQPDGRKGLQDQFTPVGREAYGFHNNWLLPLCALISLVVLVLLLFAIIRFRRGANPTPSRNSHNTLIEVLWTLIPVLILVGIAIPSIRLVHQQYSPPPADLTVKVTGHQWYWSYEYPDNGVQFDSYMLKEAGDRTRQSNQRARTDADGPPLLAVDNRVVIPQGKVVKFIVTADDVIHSFAVPAFWIKQDANPGQLHETWVKVDRPGVYFGQCSELCGARHAFMPIAVEVVPQAQFASWVASKGGHIGAANPSVAVQPVTGGTAGGNAPPAPAVAGTRVSNQTPAPTNPNVANRPAAQK